VNSDIRARFSRKIVGEKRQTDKTDGDLNISSSRLLIVVDFQHFNTQHMRELYHRFIVLAGFFLLGSLLTGLLSGVHLAAQDTTAFIEVTPPDSLFVTPPEEDFWVIATAPADYDNDGDMDIAVLGYYVIYFESATDRLVLMRNDGAAGDTAWNFTYVDVPLEGMSSGASDLAWGDMDGDGDMDLAIGSDGRTEIYRNDAGTLTMIATDLPAYWEDNDQAYFDLRSITWADFDNDSDPDLLIPSVWNDTAYFFNTFLMRNDGPDGTTGWIFTPADPGFAGAAHAQGSWADNDSDQDLDLFLVNMDPIMDSGFIRRYSNNGDGTFAGEDILGSLTIEHGEAQWGDYDNDGDLDILVAGNLKELDGTYTMAALRIYVNNGASFDSVSVINCVPCLGWFDIYAATWADYDSDGDMDILLAGSYNSGTNIEGRARIYINDNGVFTESGIALPAPHASGDRGGTFSWLDLDGDGDLDYFIAGEYFVPGGNGLVEAQMHLYRNDSPITNLAPLSPSGLVETPQGENAVLLEWLPAEDDHTPGIALTYELELYRNSLPVTLPARLPEPGNVSAVNEWMLAGLSDGTYQWTLRAVDASYMGSPMATGEFTIGGTIGINDPTDGNDSDGLDAAGTPENYSARNFPNPFTRNTGIQFSLPRDEKVIIKIYNLTGNELTTLANKTYPAGIHTVEFNAEGLPPGLYFYSLRAGDYQTTKKMQIVR